MSGIAGIINFDGAPVDQDVLRHMVQRMTYLGPDAQTIWVNGNVGLGHTLFRTCDADIAQPFTLDHITVTAHVRIDGREDLIPQLRSAGMEANLSTPDVELLAKAYLAWGNDCLSYLIGDFAFVLWDAQKQTVMAARDHFGFQPLYYAHIGNTLIISNELGAVRKHPLVSTRLNEQAIGDFLIIQSVTWLDKSQTAFADIARLLPAHRIVGTRGQFTVQRYWLPPIDEPMLRYRTEDEYVEHFLTIFKQAVKDRMRSKRILLWLSGGLDSSCMAVMATRLVQSGEVDAELNALTMVYDRIHPDTEAYYAGLVARKLNIKQHFLRLDDFPFTQSDPLTAEPSSGPSQRGRMEASIELVASLAPTTLGGEGGDEILRPTQFWDILKGLPLKDALNLVRWEWQFLGRRPRGLGAALNPRMWVPRNAPFYFPYPMWINPDFERKMGLRQRFGKLWDWQPPRRHPVHPEAYKAILWPDRTGGQLLHQPPGKTAVGQQPFLDVRLNCFILTLPPQPWFAQKYLLRRAMRDALPGEVLERKKTPLGNLYKSLLQQPGTEWVDQWEPVPELYQYVQRAAVPPLTGDGASPYPGIDLRPLALNDWLAHYREV